jgi:hypothetical protein
MGNIFLMKIGCLQKINILWGLLQTPGPNWSANADPARLKEEGHCILSQFAMAEQLSDMLAKISNKDCLPFVLIIFVCLFIFE